MAWSCIWNIGLIGALPPCPLWRGCVLQGWAANLACEELASLASPSLCSPTMPLFTLCPSVLTENPVRHVCTYWKPCKSQFLKYFLISPLFFAPSGLLFFTTSSLCVVVTCILVWWRRQWHPTPVLLPGNSHGRRSLVGCSLWGFEESDMTEWLHFHFYALEKEMATHSSVLAWRIPGMAEPGGLPSMGSHRVGHDWSDLVAAAAYLSDLTEYTLSVCLRSLTLVKVVIDYWCCRVSVNRYL